MSNPDFPTMDEFFSRFVTAIRRSGQERVFLDKWGLNRLADAGDILSEQVQGGYESHEQTIFSGRTDGSILNLGPGMGFCVFLLAEVFPRVWVAEPDGENCLILEKIAGAYLTGSRQLAGDIVRVLHAGLCITPEAVKYWTTKQESMKKRHLKGSILNFNIAGAQELSTVLPEPVDRLYLHKVLSSLSIAASFPQLLDIGRSFLSGGGELTWSEPGYIFRDILQLNETIDMNEAFKPVFDPVGLDFELHTYTLKSPSPGREAQEEWLMIRAWRQQHERE